MGARRGAHRATHPGGVGERAPQIDVYRVNPAAGQWRARRRDAQRPLLQAIFEGADTPEARFERWLEAARSALPLLLAGGELTALRASLQQD